MATALRQVLRRVGTDQMENSASVLLGMSDTDVLVAYS